MYPLIAFKLQSFDIAPNKTYDGIYFWWNSVLSVYSGISLIGMYTGYQTVVTRSGFDFIDMMRHPDWFVESNTITLIFVLSKIAEFGDTVLILLRGRRLRFIQWYHHLLTYIYCYVSCVSTTLSRNSSPAIFCSVNLFVHTIMYGWYAASTAGYRSPAWVKHAISAIQTTQMFFGCWVIATVNHDDMWRTSSPIEFYMVSGMYGSYVLLFGNMLVSNIIGTGGTVRRKRD